MKTFAPSVALVDLDAYAANLAFLRSKIPAGCGVMPVVKADGYGHGSEAITRRALSEGATTVAVATVLQAVALRRAGISAPILVLGQPAPDALEAAIESDLQVMVSDVETARRLGEMAGEAGAVARVHCKIDTGMGRQGFPVRSAHEAVRTIARLPHTRIDGIATHFPCADRPQDGFTLGQIAGFKGLLEALKADGIQYGMAHAANSAAILNYPEATLDCVRPGLITYGIWPTAAPPEPLPVRPVLEWRSSVVVVKKLQAGDSVGYDRTFVADRPIRTAVVPVGYADGYRFGLANRGEILIRGRRCRVLGRVSMDLTVVDVSDMPGVVVGDAAILIGSDGNESVTATELADRAGTIPYDILIGIGNRVKRVYAGSPRSSARPG